MGHLLCFLSLALFAQLGWLDGMDARCVCPCVCRRVYPRRAPISHASDPRRPPSPPLTHLSSALLSHAVLFESYGVVQQNRGYGWVYPRVCVPPDRTLGPRVGVGTGGPPVHP